MALGVGAAVNTSAIHLRPQSMLSEDAVAAIVGGHCSDAFALLGMHADERGAFWVRVMLPGAVAVSALDAASGRILAPLKMRHAAGLFEGVIPRRRKRFVYRLQVTWQDGSDGVYADTFSFATLIGEQDLSDLRDGVHLRPFEIFGAHAITVGNGRLAVDGVRFAVWAPNSKRVSVVGNFNNWDGRRHPMRLRGTSGIWEIFVPHAEINDLYKFELISANGLLLPLKADPYARSAQLRPDTASIVAALPPRHVLSVARAAANARVAPVSIYEVHLGSWRKGEHGLPTWDELVDSLPDYVADLGFTHVEFMPVSEYPFDGSWGYQTLGLFAPTARFGPAQGFLRLIEACHKRGLGVLVDWVPAHFPADAHGLAEFDGTPLYEYADPREGVHRDWDTLIYNFGRNEVRNFLAGSALYWIERFGIDGLRVDAVASMLYRDYSRPTGEWLPNIHGGKENLEAISLFKRINEIVGGACPGAITIAEESTAFPGVSAPTYAGGLGFHYKWNMGWMNDTLHYMAQDPVHRRFHHEKMTFGLVYAFTENFVLPLSHDEVVHGKRSLLSKMPGDRGQKFANLRAYYGFMWGHPGKKLLFMGQEFAQPDEWNHDGHLPWALLNDWSHAGVQYLVRDLNTLYRSCPALHQLDCDSAGFEWLVSTDAGQSVLAWLRRGSDGGQMMVVCNFTPVSRVDYRIGVPAGTKKWVQRLNTDGKEYGGSSVGNGTDPLPVEPVCAHGHGQSVLLTLPPLATLFLAPA